MRPPVKPCRAAGRRKRVTEQILLPGDPPIELTLRPSARARRLSLRVSALTYELAGPPWHVAAGATAGLVAAFMTARPREARA